MAAAQPAASPPATVPDDRAYFDPHAETMPRAEIEAMQQNKLLDLIPRVYERSALIRRTWDAAGVTPDDIKSLDDFRTKAPFINKDAIRSHRDAFGDPYGGLKIVDDSELVAIGFTSGTTGDPTPVPIGRSSAIETQQLRDYWQIGARPGDYVTNLMFTFRGGQTRAAYVNIGGFTPILSPHDPSELPLVIEAIKTYRPTILYMLSTPMMIGLEKYFETSGDDPQDVFSSFKGGIFGGEPMSPRFAALAKSWGIEVFDYTTFGDVTGAMECRAHDGFHAWEDLAFAECLDDDGNPVADGEIGELVVTALDDPMAPLIRFRTEDIVRFDRRPCSCGRTHARFWTLGRKGDQTLVQGKAILPRDIQQLVERHPETKSCLFQIIRPQPVMDTLRLRVGYESIVDTPEALSVRLVETLAGHFAVPVEIDLVPAAELLKLGPPQKIPRVTKQ